MAKKQIDLFRKEISPSKMKDVEKNLAYKFDGNLGKVLAFLKSIDYTYPFVKSKSHNKLLEWALISKY